MVRLTGREPKDEVASAFTREEVAELVAESRREGLLDDEEHQLITSALGFDTTVVSSVMVPIAEVESVPRRRHPGRGRAECARTGFSRFPIDRPTRGRSADRTGGFAGYLHIRDVVDIPADRRDDPVPAERIRRAAGGRAGPPICAPRWTGCAGSARTWRRWSRRRRSRAAAGRGRANPETGAGVGRSSAWSCWRTSSRR